MKDDNYLIRGYDKDSDLYETLGSAPLVDQAVILAKALIRQQITGDEIRCSRTGEPFDWFVVTDCECETVKVFTSEFPDGITPEELEKTEEKVPEKEPDMKFIVYVSIDKPARWSEWHHGSTDSVYRSEPFDTMKQVKAFKKSVARDCPDSNLTDGKGGHEFHIGFAVVSVDMNDMENLENVSRMMSCHDLYKENSYARA